MLWVNYKHCCFALSKPKTKRLQNKNPLRTPYYLSRLKSRWVAIADREGEQALKIVILWKRIQRRDSTLSWTSSLTLLRNPSPIPGFLLLSFQFPILYQFICFIDYLDFDWQFTNIMWSYTNIITIKRQKTRQSWVCINTSGTCFFSWRSFV